MISIDESILRNPVAALPVPYLPTHYAIGKRAKRGQAALPNPETLRLSFLRASSFDFVDGWLPLLPSLA